MSYVTAIITSFTRSNTDEVTLKARGRAITTAVDAAEIARRRFMKDLNVDKIAIATEKLEQEEGGTRNVSSIEIKLKRGPAETKTEKVSKETTSTVTTAHVKLNDIGGIGAKRAEKLKSLGVKTVQDLADSDPQDLAEKLEISAKRVSKWIAEAKENL